MHKLIIGVATALSLLTPLAANAAQGVSQQRIVALWPGLYCGTGTTVVRSLYFKLDDGSWVSVPMLDPSNPNFEFYKDLRQMVHMIYSGNAGRFNGYFTSGNDVCGTPVLTSIVRGTP